MNEFSITKINKVGKVGRIISTILMICCIIGAIGALIGSVALLLIPKDTITFDVASSAVITVDANKLGSNVNVGSLTQYTDNNETSFTLEDTDFSIISIENSDNVVTVSGESSPVLVDVHNFFVVTLVASVLVALYAVNCGFAKKLCKEFETCETPFCESIIKRMKMLAYSLIPWIVLGGATDSIKASVFRGKIDVNLSLNFSIMIAVVIVLFLAYIFEYGAKLQQESDETL